MQCSYSFVSQNWRVFLALPTLWDSPKGSVSRQIQALENHLGTQLLHRTTRRVQLTQDGMVYYERAKDLLSNLDELDGLFQHDPTSISGKLRVDMPVGVARNLVIPAFPLFTAVSGN